ncbi:hypothetical protein FH972_026007 [Carpinus fangiana]|uniref:Uncharacterized protein n=1 Tax=Carpinus fangiana TaxID=176857 RepID=A0A5N6L320_9ROSI|nr:hypothetical protein FH972_026007 [Carpinus fangiana]
MDSSSAAGAASMSPPPSHSPSDLPNSTDVADENTPLILRQDGDSHGEVGVEEDSNRPSAISSLLASIKRFGARFFAPEVVRDYAQQAAIFEPSSLSIDSFTSTGIVARVQGDFVLDASRVKKQSTRNIGRVATWIARGVETKPADVTVTLPQYDDLVLGMAHVPPIVVSIVNGRHSRVDILSELTPGPVDGIRRMANEFIEGRLGDVLIAANAEVALKSGLLSFGTQTITHFLDVKAGDIPSLPKYDVQKLTVREIDLPEGERGLAAQVAVVIANKYPVDLTIPALGFEVLANGCAPEDPFIMLADATTESIHVRPKHDVPVNATGFIQKLPQEFLSACPNTRKSPLDVVVGHYMNGKPTTFYVKGSDSPEANSPKWISDLTSGIIVPVILPSSAPDNLMKNFSMTDVQFSLPDFWAEPGSPAAQPKISADIKALIGLPNEINFEVGVNQFKANATIFYKGKELGRLDLTKWQKATSRQAAAPGKSHKDLEVSTHVEKAPLNITDEEVFEDVVSALLMGSDNIRMAVRAKVAVGMQSPLGEFVIQDIPAEAIGGGDGRDLKSLGLKIGNLKITESTPSSLSITAAVNFTNPTKYTATVPYADIHILANDTVLGHGTVRNLFLVPGNNTNAQFSAVWSPSAVDGKKGTKIGRELLSQFISGFNTSLTLKTHPGSIPAQPALGKALESFEITIPTSDLLMPGEPGDGDEKRPSRPHFITDTIMHLLTSTATFTLHSPFSYTTLWITHLNATAFYKGDVVGKILNDGSVKVPPGVSETPRLPVDWSLNSVGYEALKSALGGSLFLSAEATTGVRIDQYEEQVWFKGRGIGAKVRI